MELTEAQKQIAQALGDAARQSAAAAGGVAEAETVRDALTRLLDLITAAAWLRDAAAGFYVQLTGEVE